MAIWSSGYGTGNWAVLMGHWGVCMICQPAPPQAGASDASVNSTMLAEKMGEIRVHDLITRFFFDIDRPIADHGGEIHAYIGDQVVVSWALSNDSVRNAASLRCFFAIRDKMERLAGVYQRDLGVVPRFRAGLHAGPVVISECGDTKRQLAYFGDTMNVTARLQEYCKTIEEALVVSGELLRNIEMPVGLGISDRGDIVLRGRERHLDASVVHQFPSQQSGFEADGRSRGRRWSIAP
jgi:class 3 adenylate cyclase